MSGDNASASGVPFDTCPNCGNRTTFKLMGVQYVEQSRCEFSIYECPRCGFRIVTMKRRLADTVAPAGEKDRSQ